MDLWLAAEIKHRDTLCPAQTYSFLKLEAKYFKIMITI